MVIILDTLTIENVQVYRENGKWKIGLNAKLRGGEEIKTISISYDLAEHQLQYITNLLSPFVHRLKAEFETPHGEEWADNIRN